MIDFSQRFLTWRILADWALGYGLGKVSGHTGPVLDIKFDAFNDNVIASGSEDTTVSVISQS